MKKIQIVFVAIIAIVITSVMLSNPLQAVSEKQKANAAAIPDSVKSILANSCVPCHTTGGKDIALAAWDLSAIDSYSTKKLAKKARSMCKAIRDSSMPPAKFIATHPEKMPTPAQAKVICNWARSLKEK